jgi:hypothetical protein
VANAQYITPIVASISAILQSYTPALLASGDYGPFVDYGFCFTGVVENPPALWVMPVKTNIDDEGTTQKERHEITVKFAVTGSEPDDLVNAAMAYMVALTMAIRSAQVTDWQGGVIPLRVLVFEQDYGPTYQREGDSGEISGAALVSRDRGVVKQRYLVILPFEDGGKLYEHGVEVELDADTASRHSYCLIAIKKEMKTPYGRTS